MLSGRIESRFRKIAVSWYGKNVKRMAFVLYSWTLNELI
jgi:hypothetical protein